MKKLFVFIVLPLLLIATTAFGEPNLEGCWYVEIDCIGYTGSEDPFNIKIQDQYNGLFFLDNCDDYEADPCYGAIEGTKIYITCWDNIITGGFKGNKMSFITQNQNPAPGSETAGTCKGTATKVDYGECSGCPPYIDDDGDGYGSTVDCDDTDLAVNPGADEVCYDVIDNNCDGNVDEGCASS